MDPDSPISRVGRTFWTVWNYISVALERLLRPEPNNTDSNDPDSSQQSAVDSEPASSGHPVGDISGGGVDEEQPLVTAPPLSSLRPVVAWELCTTDIDLGPVEESVQDKSKEEGEGTREEEFSQTRNDDAELLVAKDAKEEEEENGDWKLYTHEQDEVPENDEYEERAKMGSPNLTEDAMKEDMEGSESKAGPEDETQGALDVHQKMDETMREIQVKEEGDKMYHEDERDLEAEATEIALCPVTDFSLEEEQSMHVEEARVQRDEVVTAVMYKEVENSGGVLQLDSANENKYDEGGKQVENQFSSSEELSENDRDVKGDPDVTSLEDDLQIALKTSGSVSEDVGQVHLMAHRSESEDEREKDESTYDEREQSEEDNVNEAIDEEPEQEEDVKTGSEDSRGVFTEHVTCIDEIRQHTEAELHTAEFTDEEKEDLAKDTKLQTKTSESDEFDGAVIDEKSHVTTTDISVNERFCDEDQVEEERLSSEKEEETQGALDDHQKMDETMREIQVKEEGDKMYHEDERDLEAEATKIALCPVADFSLEEEQSMHVEEARVQRDEVVTAVMYKEVENSGGVLQLDSENENKYDEGAKQVENQFSSSEELSENDRDVKGDPDVTSLEDDLQIALKTSGSVSEDVGQVHLMAHRSESEDEREKDESTYDEREQSEEDNVNEAIDEEPEQEEDVKTGSEDSRGVFTEHVTCIDEIRQHTEAELHTAEFTDEEKEDLAKDTKLQTKTSESDEFDGAVIDEKSHVTTTDISVNERFSDEDQVEEERLSSEKEDNKESYMEIACTTTSVTVKPEGETGEEKSGEFKIIPVGICEDPVVVSQGLNPSTSEETQEGVPEYNNEPGFIEENITQRFLEAGDCMGIHAIELPEEVESKEPERLQKSGAGGDCLMLREHMEEEQENTEDIKREHTGILHITDTGLPQETEELLVEPVIEGSGHLVEEEGGKLLESSMKMGIEHSEKDFEIHVGVTDVTDKTTKELQDRTEELLVEFEIDEGLSDSKDGAGDCFERTGATAAEDSVGGFADESLRMLEAESVDTMNFEQNSNMTPNLLESITESGFMKEPVETKPKLLEDSSIEMQDAGIDMEEPGYGVEEEEVEMQNNNEMEFLNPEVAGMAADLTTENNASMLFGEFQFSRPDESLETKNQQSDKAFEMSREEMLPDTEATPSSESRPKDLTLIPTVEVAKHVTESGGSYAEETSSSVSQDVIDEELLDLWIQTASIKDTDDMEQQEGPEPGQQMDTEIEPSNEEKDEMSSVQAEEEQEQLVESNSGESGLLSDTEMSSLAAESGFLDQSVSTNHSDTHLLKSPSTGSFQGTYDMLASMSEPADISELPTQQPNSESQHILMEGPVETRQSDLTEVESIEETRFYSDSGVISSGAGHLSQESDKSQEKTDEEQVESAATKTGSQEEMGADVMDLARTTDWKDTEEEMGSLFKVEDVPLEVTVSDSPDKIKQAESGRSRSGSEASLQEEIMVTESQDDACAESKRLPSLDKQQPGWSEDIAESLPELNRAEVAEQLTSKSEDQTEVDGSVLDFTAQRSRIAVKNPRVRPPTDPRSLLHMPSVEPTPSSHLPVRVPVGVPLGGMGIGIKLPGLGAGFPVLKKTPRVVKEDNSSENLSQEAEARSEEMSDAPKQDETPHKPKWMPPKHPGFGNPLMSELKTKLKKTTKE